ncbi:hypothetical protein [Mesomycoplasma bovoculi]|uniref:HMA domain-containing protein n=1 Tax=Mesomycoplasma bovoculi M165/69 TaxID=743966 RepID=W5USN9_9BACT|nr:hypothetical protein [Mesomycoplasma bovoculi]AHH45229.1 hypothetical protein MYB_01090 [Mesomycoplasma bovoculi M165/69]
MTTTRRFSVPIKCASCNVTFEKLFSKYEDLQWFANVSEKILKIVADEEKYSDEFIEELLKSVGYVAERID